MTFEVAAEALLHVQRATGLGVALGEVPGEEIRLAGIDLDHCYVNGELTEHAIEVICAAQSYSEKSLSGEGVHIIGTGDIGTLKVHGCEIYSGARYFTVTGQGLNGANLSDLTDAAAFARKLYGAAVMNGAGAENPSPVPYDSDPIIAALVRAGLYLRDGGGGKHLIRCPWEARHSPNAAGERHTSNSEAAYFSPGAVVRDRRLDHGMFKCQHAHCADRHLRHLREFLGLASNGDAQEPGPDRMPLDWRALDGQEPPERRWAIQYWILMGHVTLLAGAPGTGKSLVAQAMGSCLSLQREYLDWVPQPLRVLLWMCEDDTDELWRRQRAIAQALGVPLSAFADILTVHSYDGRQVELAGLLDQRLIASPMLTELREQIGDYRADVVFLDNSARLYGGSENDRHQVTSFIAMLTAAARPRNAAIILLGHPGKAAGSEYSGSTASEGAVRGRLYLGRSLPDAGDKDGEEPEGDDIRYLCRRKANYSARDYRRLQYLNGVMVADPPTESPGTSPITAEYARDVLTRAVRKLAQMGHYGVAGKGSPNYLPKLVRTYKLAERLTERDITSVMVEMQKAGQLVMAGGWAATRIAPSAWP